MKINEKLPLAVKIIGAVFAVFASFFMYDFYKCLSGFVANGFREPLVMLPMILAFFLPVFCYLFFFYDFFVGKINTAVKIVYSSFVILYAAANLILIFANIKLYVSNNSLGVYDTLPSFALRFPFDMITLHFVLLALQILNLVIIFKKGTCAETFLNTLRQRGNVKVSVLEYVFLSVLAIVAFVFFGSAVTAAFTAFENVFYSGKFLYLLLLVGIIPMGNLVFLAIKPERYAKARTKKLMMLIIPIAVNLIFTLLFFVFEAIHPDFLVYIGKPFFLIAFSVSMPIEPAVIIGVMAVSTLIYAVRLIYNLVENHVE